MKHVTDTVLIVRCPYCVAGMDFRPMVAESSGQFVCLGCEHTVAAFEPSYQCGCEKCGRLGEFLRFTPVSAGVSAA